MPDELLTFLAAMTPVGELRAAIPLGILRFDLAWPVVFVLSVVGNVFPIPFLVYGLPIAGRRVQRIEVVDERTGSTWSLLGEATVLGRALRWWTARIERRWAGLVRRYGVLAIVLIVAIPLPFTGAWTGSVVVWVFGMQPVRGLLAIAAGVLIAGVLVTALTLAGVELVKIV